MNTINGIEYYRRKRCMKKIDLEKASGVSVSCIAEHEAMPTLDNSRMEIILRLADGLGVTVDQLLEIHSRSELTPLDRSFRVSDEHNPRNPIANYRKSKNLTLRELGKLLGGLTKWGTSKVCRMNDPPIRHIRALAILEDMSVEEFLDMYCYRKEDEDEIQ